MFSYDQSFNHFFSNVNNPLFYKAFYFASWLFSTVPFTVLLIFSSLIVYKKYGKKEGLFFLYSSILAVILSLILKYTFNIPRPLGLKIFAFGPSFPSMHTAVATAYFLSLLHFLRQTKNKLRRYVHIAFCIACPLFVGVSRLYFGVHWLSDVVAGYIIGAISVYVSIWFSNRTSKSGTISSSKF